MADLPEPWTEGLPAPRHLFDRTPRFGLAREAEGLPEEVPPDLPQPSPRKPRRERGPFMTYLVLPWSYGDRSPSDRWHRIRCLLGRHEIQGGHFVPTGGSLVFVERRCRWCEAEGAAPLP